MADLFIMNKIFNIVFLTLYYNEDSMQTAEKERRWGGVGGVMS